MTSTFIRPERESRRILPRSRSLFLLAALFCVWLPGCQPDESPLKVENENLRKQVEKQESVILSLQDGNKVMQQQIDLLNKELREAKEQVERVMTERTTLTAQLDEQEGKTKKLTAEAQRIADRAASLAQALRIDEKGGVSEEVSQSMTAVTKAAEEALNKHGYAVLLSVKTEQKAAYVTERKVSEPASLEVPGFRNQYLIAIHAVSPTRTRITVKADFERMAQGHRILPAGSEETTEIERRLIAEIGKSMPGGKA